MSDMYFKSLPDKSTPLIPSNLDKLNDIKVSPAEPTTNEKMWIQMSKNLLKAPFTESNKKTITSSSDDFSEITDYSVYLEAGKQYTISFKTDGVLGSNGADTVELFLLKNKNAGEGFYQINTNPKTITVGASGDYYVRFDVNKNGRTYSFWDIQIEKCSTATEYEPYVEKAIHIKNDNGVYEEFYNEGKIKNNLNSSELDVSWKATHKVRYSDIRVPKLVFLHWANSVRIYVIYLDKVILVGENGNDTVNVTIDSTNKIVTFALSNTGIMYASEFPTNPTL